MIQAQSKLNIADNTGAKEAVCIGILGRGGAKTASIGDLITLSVKKVLPRGQIKKGEIVRGVIVRTKHPIGRLDGTRVRFDDNAVVLIGTGKLPRGTRIFGPVARELREKGFPKIISQAPEIV